MNKPRVTIEQAVRLKALGYDVKTDGHFNTEKNSPLRIDSAYDYNRYTNACSVPDVDDVCRWLRDVHGMHVNIMPNRIFSAWWVRVYFDDKSPTHKFDITKSSDNHDTAQSAAIDACLTILEKRKKTQQ